MKRWSIRTRMTALYSGLFFLSGVVLLAFVYFAMRASELYVENERLSDRGAIAPSVQRSRQTSIPVEAEIFEVISADQVSLELLLKWSVVALVLMTGISILLGYFIAGRILRSISKIRATAQELSTTQLSQRIALQGPHDELWALANTFDAMLDRIQESFESERRLTANMSHELRTPLAIQRAFLELAFEEDGTTTEEMQRAGKLALDQNRRATGIIEGMLVLARVANDVEKKSDPVDLGSLADKICDEMSYYARDCALTVECTIDEKAFIRANPILIERLVYNVINNAVVHNRHDGWVNLTVIETKSRVCLTIENSGQALDQDTIDHLRSPFRRGKNDRTDSHAGFGLGLTIVESIADYHHADLSISPGREGGLRICVSFPSMTESPAKSMNAAAIDGSDQHEPHDDDEGANENQ